MDHRALRVRVFLSVLILASLCVGTFFVAHYFLQKKTAFELKAGCMSGGAKYDACLSDYYTKSASLNGVALALKELDRDIATYPRLSADCHNIMHNIGRAGAIEFGTLGNAFSHGTRVCENGYYHGVVEGIMRGVKLGSLSQTFVREVCASDALVASSPFLMENCVHGMGHAFVYISNDDLSQSLLRCGDFDGDSEKSQCMTGVFMEDNQSKKMANGGTTSNDLTIHCSQLPSGQEGCWLLQGVSIIAKEIPAITSETFCEKFEESGYRERCMRLLNK